MNIYGAAAYAHCLACLRPRYRLVRPERGTLCCPGGGQRWRSHQPCLPGLRLPVLAIIAGQLADLLWRYSRAHSQQNTLPLSHASLPTHEQHLRYTSPLAQD